MIFSKINEIEHKGHTVKLIGREQELQILENFIVNRRRGNIVICGVSDCGKSWLLRHFAGDCFKIMTVIHDPLAKAQTFIKDLSKELLNQLSFEEKNRFFLQIRDLMGESFHFFSWVDSDSHFLSDGYIFHRLIEFFSQTFEKRPVLIVDQAERLCKESRILLKHLLEWQGECATWILSIKTESPGREGIALDHGSDFFFKGNQYLELKPISSIFKTEFLQLHGIEENLNTNNFMAIARWQKLAWIKEQSQTCPILTEFLQKVSQNPQGCKIEEILESFDEVVQVLPLITEILDIGCGKIALHYEEFREEFFQKKDPYLPSSSDSPGKILANLNPENSKLCIQVLSSVYLESATLSLLSQMIHALHENPLESPISTRALSILENPPKDGWNLFFQILKTQEFRKELLSLSLTKAIEHKSWYEWFQALIQSQILLDEEISLKIVWQGACLGMVFDENLLDSFPNKKALLELAKFAQEPIIPSRELAMNFPEHYGIKNFIEAIHFNNLGDFEAAASELKKGISRCIRSQNFLFLPALLTELSQTCYHAGDEDSRIHWYRQAVIAQQFHF